MDARIEQYREQGFVVLPQVLDRAALAALRGALQPYLDLEVEGRNPFEGTHTRRVYSLVGRGRVFEETAENPEVLALLDALLQPGYLLTASQAICIGPGETPQPLHYDDAFYPLSRPRPEVSVSTIWALEDFSADNGATEVIPGSHRWDDARVAEATRVRLRSLTNPEPEKADVPALAQQLQPLEMEAGSLVVFAGTLLHRGGANPGTGTRSAFSHQYCQPWARQQENFMLSIPHERIRAMSPRLRQLLGFSILPPFMGQIAGRHPEKALAPDYVNSLEADDAEVQRRRRPAP